jgi:hypothetical protein
MPMPRPQNHGVFAALRITCDGSLDGRFCAGFEVTTVGALWTILENPLSPLDTGSRTVERLTWIYGASGLPFFFAGCVITLAISRYAKQMSRLYLFDLGGAATGCLLLIPALDRLGAVNAVLAVATVAAVAAVVLDGTPSGRR